LYMFQKGKTEKRNSPVEIWVWSYIFCI
jgi:hypothetical protein